MRTAKEIIAAIGQDRVQQMFARGPKSVDRAALQNCFTASWARGIDKELIENGHPSLTSEELDRLFTFKIRLPAQSS